MQNPIIPPKPLEPSQHSDSKKSSDKNNQNFTTSTKFEPLEIPPPDDMESSSNSLNSSVSLPDFNTLDQLNLIKSKNKELKRTATLTFQDFKNTSRSLISRSQMNSNRESFILNADGCEKRSPETKNLGSTETDGDVGMIYRRIKEIQTEINEASQKLVYSERMILTAEEKNSMIEEKIKVLEKNIEKSSMVEGPEKSISEYCKCVVL